jgi:glycyl-tRNA synthetase (class II)
MMAEMYKLVSPCRRRGLIFQSSEIYGGQGASRDCGPGLERSILKRNGNVAEITRCVTS